ncbi:hypothetical protein SAY86_019251 [Trapa natans]|uniref:Uncharacterized protein n=1 Tax=Trapa natans TaxID=22666 RepID=A0AAN7LLW7_TRANT|nr:hypothetical protein SAY86_019251 [Trapa natans]
MEVVDRCQIFLPPDFTPPSTVPLSFLDIPWLFLSSPVQRVLFYNLPQGYTFQEFTGTALPSFKHSLSLALQRFYPLSGSLACALPKGRPHILCSKESSVPFTAAVSTADFDEITSDSPQEASLLHQLVPTLGGPIVKDGTRLAPLFSVQVTLFPSKGISIGVHFLHIVADGMAISHFMKTWASICRAELQGDSSCILNSLPVHDRCLLKDPNGIETIWMENGGKLIPPPEKDHGLIRRQPADKVYRATFTLSRDHIDRLKSWILNQSEEQLQHLSTFVAICAYAWVCLIKSMEAEKATGSSNTDIVYGFAFSADCRGRLGYPIPNSYFGNCLSLHFVLLMRDDLVGRQGILLAARAIGAKVNELGEEGAPLRALERFFVDVDEVCTVHTLIVSGTTRQRFYDTDFGWGRPWKSLAGHIDRGTCISLAESREGSDGLEIGLAGTKATMDAFSAIFEQGIRSMDV